MSIPVTRTKYILPRRRADLLTRQRLLDILLDLLDQRLIIVAAPAGYGKTSLLVDFACQTNLPVCWYSIDPLDRDFTRFAAYLIASIHNRFPKFGKNSTQALHSISPVKNNLNPLVTTMVNEAYECIQEHFVIVLDDYHFVNEHPEINAFLGRLIQDMDENCHVVISSRTLLALPDLPLMVARSQVGGLGLEELSFQPEEIRSFIQQNYQIAITENEAAQIADQTEGWITGLILSTQNKWQGNGDQLRLARVSAVGLYEYLAQQVLDQQSPPVRSFLLQTSIMDEFDPALCLEVLGPPPEEASTWSSMMETILRNNLFVLPVGDKGLWLRYHHLFRDFLQERYAAENPAEQDQILKRLADVYTKHGEWDRAHALYHRLGKTDDLASLIQSAGSTLIKTGRMTTLASWIDGLPADQLPDHPALLSLRGSVALMVGEVERGLSLLNHGEAIARKNGDQAELVRTLSRRTHAHRFLGNYQASLQDSEVALTLARDDDSLRPFEAEAYRCRGLSLHRLGRSDEAIESLKQSAGIYDAIGSAENLAMVRIEIGLVYRSLGAFHQARQAYESALSQLTRIGDLTRQAAVYNNLGVLYQTLGDYQKAASYLEQAIQNAEQSGYTRVQAMALSSIGDLYLDLDSIETAQAAYRKAREIAAWINDGYLLFYITLAEASLARLGDDFRLAWKTLAVARKTAEENKSPPETALCSLEAGKLMLAEKDFQGAAASLQECAGFFDNNQQVLERIPAHFLLGIALLASGSPDPARQHLEQAFRLAEQVQSRHLLVTCARGVEELLPAARAIPTLRAEMNMLLADIDRFETNIPAARKKLRLQSLTVPFAPPKLTIRTLGRAQVLLDGKVISSSKWQTQVSRDLLFLLLIHPEGLTKEAIASVFWQDCSPTQVKLQFKNTVYRVRHAVEQEVIILDDERYSFNRDLDYEYDVELFHEKLSAAHAQTSPTDQITAYKTALHLYKGDYLPEIEGSWVVRERERLHQAYVGAVLRLAELLLNHGDLKLALRYCRDILVKDACLEEAHRLAMRIHAAMGNMVEVVRQYESCQQVLQKEVGLPPSNQTRELYDTLIH